MEDRDMKLIEKFSDDFYQLSSREGWTKEDLENMKNLQKLMYYIELRCAMKEELEEDEDEEEMEYSSRSYGGGRDYGNRYYEGGNMYGRGGNSYNGRYGRSGRSGRSGGRRSYGQSYGGGNSYNSRRYYDSEKENSMNDLRQMISMEQDPEKRSMLENIMHSLEK